MRIRNWRCGIGALALAIAPVLAVVPATPAAASTGHLCMTFGNHWCVGAAGSFGPGPGDPAINKNHTGMTIVFAPGPGGTATLHSKAAPGLCLAPKSSTNMAIAWRLCNVTGTLWNWVTARNTHYFTSVHYRGMRLSASNIRGDVLAACQPGGCPGQNFTFQQWTGPS